MLVERFVLTVINEDYYYYYYYYEAVRGACAPCSFLTFLQFITDYTHTS